MDDSHLLEGLDDIGLTLQNEADITAFEQTRASWRPRTLPAKHLPPVNVMAARPVGGDGEGLPAHAEAPLA